MKKILVCLMVVVCLLGLGSVAFGKSGSAIIPHFDASGSVQAYYLYISNITSEPISVVVTLYKQDGSIVIGSNVSNYGAGISDWNINPNNATVSFTLDSNCTAEVYTTSSLVGTTWGYGNIEWSQNSRASQGLVAYAFAECNSAYHFTKNDVMINNGQPF